MPTRNRAARVAMYNTPAIRTGGFGALQVEALTNRPLSIARRHLAASQLRMRDIEPDELSSSEWVRFLVMEERERERWIADFARRRRSSSSSSSSSSFSSSSPFSPTTLDAEQAYDKAEEARAEAEEARQTGRGEAATATAEGGRGGRGDHRSRPVGTTPAVSLWVRQFDGEHMPPPSSSMRGRPPAHFRRAVADSLIDAPPTYESAVRPHTPPPAYAPRGAAPL